MKLFGGTKKCSLEVLGFPCSQFMNQEPSTNDELLNLLKYVRPGNGFEPEFDMFAKVEVNGKSEIDLFTYLKKTCPRPTDTISEFPNLLWAPVKTTDIEWNFEKFLIDHNGAPLKRYSPATYPLTIKEDIEEAINRCNKDSKKAKHLDMDYLVSSYLKNQLHENNDDV